MSDSKQHVTVSWKRNKACDFERIDAKLTKRYDFNSRCLEFLVYLQAEMIKGDRCKRILMISYYC